MYRSEQHHRVILNDDPAILGRSRLRRGILKIFLLNERAG